MKVSKTTSKINDKAQKVWESMGHSNHVALRTFSFAEVSGSEGPIAPHIETIKTALSQIAVEINRAPIASEPKEKAVRSVNLITTSDIVSLLYKNMRGDHLEGLFKEGLLPRPNKTTASDGNEVEADVSDW